MLNFAMFVIVCPFYNIKFRLFFSLLYPRLVPRDPRIRDISCAAADGGGLAILHIYGWGAGPPCPVARGAAAAFEDFERDAGRGRAGPGRGGGGRAPRPENREISRSASGARNETQRV